MVAIIEIYQDNGWCHVPDFSYIALTGSLKEMDAEALKIVKSLGNSEHIYQVAVGERRVEAFTDTRLCM